MNIVRVNLHHSFESFKRDQIITCPLDHSGYHDLIDAKTGDFILVATSIKKIGAIAVVESNHIGNLDYYTLGGRVTLDKRTIVQTRVLAYFDDLTQEEFVDTVGVSSNVFSCPAFSYKITEFSHAAFRDLLNNQITNNLE